MSVEELLEKARMEISKIKIGTKSDLKSTDSTIEDAKIVIDNAIMFADVVIKELVAHTIGCSVNEIFDSEINTVGEILINLDKKKYIMKLGIVDRDYMLDLGELKDDEQIKSRIVFLLNTVKILFNPIKDYMRKWSAKRDKSFNYVLQIGLNTTLFLDKDMEKRIGIILNRAN